MSRFARVLVPLVIVASASAQLGPVWVPRYPSMEPQERHRFVFCSAPTGGVVLFGGASLAPPFILGDTWRWDGDGWAQVPVPHSPSPRSSCCSALDTGRGVVVLFGGTDGSSLLDETWEFDGRDWRRLTPAIAPVARVGATLCFDSTQGRCLLFGGTAQGTYGPYDLDDLWAWDGATWTRLGVTAGPMPRHSHAAAYDVRRGRLVVVGGGELSSRRFADTWEFDGTRWQSAAVGPATDLNASMVFESERNRCVILGLYVGHMEWDGSVWRVVEPPTPRPDSWRPSGLSTLAYDSFSKTIVAFGDERYSVTWEYALDLRRARLRSFGVTTCAPATTLSLVSSGRPVLGTTALPLRFQYAAPNAVGVVQFDFEPRQLAINSRCYLYVPGSGPALPTVADAFGRCSVGISIPYLTSLVGWEFYAQLASTGGPAFDRWAMSSGVGILVGR